MLQSRSNGGAKSSGQPYSKTNGLNFSRSCRRFERLKTWNDGQCKRFIKFQIFFQFWHKPYIDPRVLFSASTILLSNFGGTNCHAHQMGKSTQLSARSHKAPRYPHQRLRNRVRPSFWRFLLMLKSTRFSVLFCSMSNVLVHKKFQFLSVFSHEVVAWATRHALTLLAAWVDNQFNALPDWCRSEGVPPFTWRNKSKFRTKRWNFYISHLNWQLTVFLIDS